MTRVGKIATTVVTAVSTAAFVYGIYEAYKGPGTTKEKLKKVANRASNVAHNDAM